jgi:hypothetical protein
MFTAVLTAVTAHLLGAQIDFIALDRVFTTGDVIDVLIALLYQP